MGTEPRQIREQVRRELWELQLRLKGQGKRMAWEQLFRESDRKRVTQQELENRHIADIWADLRGISVWRAVLDLALKLNLLWPQRYEYLLEQIGEKPSATGVPAYPVWDRDNRRLLFEGKVARTVRSLTVAKYVVAILDEFEKLGCSRRG